MNSSNKYIKEVEQALARHANNKNKADQIASQRYLGTSLAVWGIASPLQKQLCKSGYSFYSDNKTATFQIYTEIYKGSTVHEVRSQALIYLEQNYRHIPPALQAEHCPIGWRCVKTGHIPIT